TPLPRSSPPPEEASSGTTPSPPGPGSFSGFQRGIRRQRGARRWSLPSGGTRGVAPRWADGGRFTGVVPAHGPGAPVHSHSPVSVAGVATAPEVTVRRPALASACHWGLCRWSPCTARPALLAAIATGFKRNDALRLTGVRP